MCAKDGRYDEQSVRHVDLLGSLERDKRDERQNLPDEYIRLVDTAFGQLVPSTCASPHDDRGAWKSHERTRYASNGSHQDIGQAATPAYDGHPPGERDDTVDRQQASDKGCVSGHAQGK